MPTLNWIGKQAVVKHQKEVPFRLIDGLWQELSGGRCRFVMVKDKRWDWIDGVL